MSFDTMGFKRYARFLMEEFRTLLNRAVNGNEPVFPWERDQKRSDQLVFAPQYSSRRISRK
jgi:hypothetical protein